MTQAPITVLVVEDEALLLFSIADDLRDEGFKVLEASSADAAIRLLETHPEIAVVFTDIDMPGSMDGLRLSAAVSERWPPVKIVVTSGKNRPAAEALPKNGVFVPKPYTHKNVAAIILGMMVGG